MLSFVLLSLLLLVLCYRKLAACNYKPIIPVIPNCLRPYDDGESIPSPMTVSSSPIMNLRWFGKLLLLLCRRKPNITPRKLSHFLNDLYIKSFWKSLVFNSATIDLRPYSDVFVHNSLNASALVAMGWNRFPHNQHTGME